MKWAHPPLLFLLPPHLLNHATHPYYDKVL
jgi:hypothetical protein